MVYKMGLTALVHSPAGFLHVLGQARWSAAEYADFTHLWKVSKLKRFILLKRTWQAKFQTGMMSPKAVDRPWGELPAVS